MANYMGSTFENTPIQSSVNLPLIQQVLSVKQGQYDENRAKIDQTLQAFGNIDLIRDVDKEYLSTKINDVYNSIDASGNRDFSQPYVADDLVGKIRNAAKDPFIMDAMTNTAKFRTFQKDVEELKKKDINKFNNINYNDALELGGFGAWSKGDTNSLGNLQYNEYVDVAAKQRKLTEDYVKNFQMKDKYIGTEQRNQYFAVDKYGYNVDEEAVKKYIEANLDEKDRTQLQINARQSIGKLPEAEFNSVIKEVKTAENRDLGLQIANLEASAKTATGQTKTLIDNKIKELKTGQAENAAKIAGGKFDKSEMYSVYNKKFINDLAASYDLEGITKLEKDDSAFQVLKFNADQAYKKEDLRLKGLGLELQAAKLKAAQDANTIAMGGTPTDVDEALKPELSEEKVVQKDMGTADAALDAYLKENNIDGYRDKSSHEQWVYKTSLPYTSPIAKADPTLNSLLVGFKNAHKAYRDTFSPAVDSVKESFKTVYNDMVGGRGLNIDNLAGSMPYTAAMLKDEKTFDSLSPAEKRTVNAELMAEALRNGGLEDKQRHLVELALNRERVGLRDDKTEKGKLLNNYVKNKVVDTEDAGFLNATSSFFKSIGNLGRFVGTAVGGQLGNVYDKIFYDEAYAREEDVKRTTELGKIYSNAEKSARPFLNFQRQIFDTRGSDADISEIEAQDLRANSSIKSADVVEYLRENIGAQTIAAQNRAKAYIPTQLSNKAFSFSKEVKEQKESAIALAQVAMAQANAPAGFEDAKNVRVQREGSGYRIFALNEDDESISVNVSKIPTSIASLIDAGNANWQTSAMNKNIAVEPATIKPISSIIEREEAVDNIKNTASHLIRQEELNLIINNPAESFLATPSEMKKHYERQYGVAAVKANEKLIDKIINLDLAYKPYPYGGEFRAKIRYKDPITGELEEETMEEQLGNQYVPEAFYMQYMNSARTLKDRKVYDLIHPQKN